LAVLTNGQNCTFEEASKSVASVDIDDIFPPQADAIHSNDSVVAGIRLPLFDLGRDSPITKNYS
jgi:hypothetical protein